MVDVKHDMERKSNNKCIEISYSKLQIFTGN